MKKAGILLVAAAAVLMAFLFLGCGRGTTPPTADDIEEILEENKEDFLLITKYLMESDGDCFIDKTDGTIFRSETFSYEKIEEKEIIKCISRLKTHAKFKMISKHDNTIEFYIWGHWIQPIECGAAYSIDGSGELSIQFLLRQEPLSEPGWYYYYADDNEWRVEQKYGSASSGS